MLKKLSLKGVGPAPEMEVEFAERLTVITGDNGLGKSFILDAVWFGMSEIFFDRDIAPQEGTEAEILLAFNYEEEVSRRYNFERHTQQWRNRTKATELYTGLFYGVPILYLGNIGAIGVYEPARRPSTPPYASVYLSDEIERGSTKPVKFPLNGMLSDLGTWFYRKEAPFYEISAALSALSEGFESQIKIEEPKRISVSDSRQIPQISTILGQIPLTLASAGMQRIISLAYMLVWAWEEHKIICNIKGTSYAKSILFLIDEIETHLHPKWQRKILAAVLEVAKAITEDEGFQVQVICTTHSPIVLTGIEPHFDPEKDKLLDLQLTPGASGERGTVELREVEFEKLGSVGDWLMSDMFNVDDKPEPNVDALKKRAALFEQEKPTQAEIDEVDRLMRAHFAPDHPERTHWVWLAKQKGLTLRGQQ